MIKGKLNGRDYLLSLSWEPEMYVSLGLPPITQSKWLRSGGSYVNWRVRKWRARVRLVLERGVQWRGRREKNPDYHPKELRKPREKNTLLEERKLERYVRAALGRKAKRP